MGRVGGGVPAGLRLPIGRTAKSATLPLRRTREGLRISNPEAAAARAEPLVLKGAVRLRNGPPKLELRFGVDKIDHWAERYVQYSKDSLEARIEDQIAPRSRSAGYFEKADFIDVCRWKTPRIVPHCVRNSEELIRAVTTAAFRTPCEEFRITAPTLLRGVGWRVASVLLHFAHPDPYPILDFRALWSLGWDLDAERDDYDFEFWQNYVQVCRKLQEQNPVSSMRHLDRALWQYSKGNQESSQETVSEG
jgi:hypothetical protein